MSDENEPPIPPLPPFGESFGNTGPGQNASQTFNQLRNAGLTRQRFTLQELQEILSADSAGQSNTSRLQPENSSSTKISSISTPKSTSTSNKKESISETKNKASASQSALTKAIPRTSAPKGPLPSTGPIRKMKRPGDAPTTANSSSEAVSPAKQRKKEGAPPVQPITTKDIQEMDSNFDSPIFTKEFLDHNKVLDAKLEQLKIFNTYYEQQNVMLSKHNENMKDIITKLKNETLQQEENNAFLQKHLEHLRVTLTNGFSDVELPGTQEMATHANIDSYITNLHSILLENGSNDANFQQIVRSIRDWLDFNE